MTKIAHKTVLVVEDEPAICELIAINLQHAGFIPIRAYDASMAIRMIADVVPDIILLDWMMPTKSGLQLARELRADERTAEVPIIMITARSEESDKISGLDAGADDYVTKPFSPRELIARVRAVLRRRAPQLTDDAVAVGPLRLDPVRHRVYLVGDEGDQTLELGPTEFRLLHFMMTHPERVHSRAQILDKVWGDHVFVEERTVDVQIKRLRACLSKGDVAELIETVRGAGYRLSADGLRERRRRSATTTAEARM
ncbi:phosphate regulon transcriptional regulator PhoB [Cupriavidus sp. U2]|uniref:phosphate regulon transcriptional regulator PhoB n=1 Tax=Cupriavidus sp. U2 TaxID=2920269 RepID=UPI00129D38E7|nr:phosphate regulon transcriptional regulator PhoB [Cupriavidus sp. U2]